MEYKGTVENNSSYVKRTSGDWTGNTESVEIKNGGKAIPLPKTKGRKTAKKSGGGGSYTWGKPGDEINAPSVLNKDDPNYDSEEEDENVILYSTLDRHEEAARRAGVPVKDFGYAPPSRSEYRGNFQRKAPKTPLAQFKTSVIRMIDEFFSSEDEAEFIKGLEELDSSILHFELVRRLITKAMERNDRERGMASELLSSLAGRELLSIEQCGKGFERIFELIDDIVLDTPHAKRYVSQFLARAIADEVLPPAFLGDSLVESLGGEIVEQAKVLLSIKHGIVRLEHVWGTNEGAPVEELKSEIKMILLEYLNSSDIDEVFECVRKLHVPRFHHELVKRAVVIAMDNHQRERAMMSTLLSELVSKQVVTTLQFQLGFSRLVDEAEDLELDTPGAKEILRVFVQQAVKDRCLDEQFANELLSRIESKDK